MSEEESTQINQFGQTAGALIHRWGSICFWWIKLFSGAWCSCPTFLFTFIFYHANPCCRELRFHYALSQLHEDWSWIDFLKSLWIKYVTFTFTFTLSKKGSLNFETTQWLWLSVAVIRSETKSSLGASVASWFRVALMPSLRKMSLYTHPLLRYSAPWSGLLRENAQSHTKEMSIKLLCAQLPFKSLQSH